MIHSYSLKEFGLSQAERYIREIDNCFQKTANNPVISRSCAHINTDLRAVNVASHVIFFKITIDGIVIIRVLHKMMDFIQHFKKNKKLSAIEINDDPTAPLTEDEW